MRADIVSAKNKLFVHVRCNDEDKLDKLGASYKLQSEVEQQAVPLAKLADV